LGLALFGALAVLSVVVAVGADPVLVKVGAVVAAVCFAIVAGAAVLSMRRLRRESSEDTAP
jgi:hypothetical protein